LFYISVALILLKIGRGREWEIKFTLENYDFPMQIACYAKERVLWVVL
jgi:hypothetical protein